MGTSIRAWPAVRRRRYNESSIPPKESQCRFTIGGAFRPGCSTTFISGGLRPSAMLSQLRASSRWILRVLIEPQSGVTERQPNTRFVIQSAEENLYAAKADRIAIRRGLRDLVAVIEIVSPGNKSSQQAIRSFS